MKTLGYALGFQHSTRDLVNVNEWKIMFDPYSNIGKGMDIICTCIHYINFFSITRLNFFQITRKFRDEMAPRYGLLRGREFEMKGTVIMF